MTLDQKKLNKSLYCEVEGFEYKNNMTFSSGMVKKSPHGCNTVYLCVVEDVYHLRRDEAVAIIAALSKALWCDDIAKMNRYRGFKWKSHKAMVKRWSK